MLRYLIVMMNEYMFFFWGGRRGGQKIMNPGGIINFTII